VIVDAMRTWQPDLTVVGSRGHGSIGSALLGSVSAAVVDHATTPVLVVRGERISRIIFAEDGSEDAAAAAAILTGWPIFAGLPVSVVSVVDVAAPWRTGIAPTMFSAAMDVYGEMLDSARTEYRQAGERTVAAFRAVGLDATMELREGDPAGQISAAASDTAGDLIVIGSRGHTGVSRLVLGSVAHSVLLHSHASVLIVRHVAS
jgi:nucleotide-binding universal stress UspA family protein